jgi:hypothetical protein
MTNKIFGVFFVLLVLEGALRKWIFPGISAELFALKDVVLFAIFLLVLSDTKRGEARWIVLQQYQLLIAVWMMVCVISLLASGFELQNLIGTRYYFVPWLVAILTPSLLQDGETKFERRIFLLFLLALPVGVLAVYQFGAAPTDEINQYAWRSATDVAVIEVGEQDDLRSAARVSSTFSYISTYGAFLQFIWLCGLALLIRSGSGLRTVVLAIGMALILGNMLMTGSRGVALSSLVATVPFVVVWLIQGIRKGSASNWIIAIGAFAGIAVVLVMPVLFEALWERNLLADDANERVFGTLLTPIYTIENSSFFGRGIGSTFLGVSELRQEDFSEMLFDEFSQDRTAVEFGIFGYLFFLGVKIWLVGVSIALWSKAKSEFVQVWALVSIMFQIEYVWVIPLYNAVASTFYFACIGAVVALNKINLKESGSATMHAGAVSSGYLYKS